VVGRLLRGAAALRHAGRLQDLPLHRAAVALPQLQRVEQPSGGQPQLVQPQR
jgi:hypothetical protein